MTTRAARLGLGLGFSALATSACALTGYDFGDYQPAAPTAGAPAGGDGTTGKLGPIATTFGVGGDPDLGPSSGGRSGDGGEGEDGGSSATEGGACVTSAAGAAGDATASACEPLPCADLGEECGLADNGCGATQNCGPCFWWFQECVANVCEITK